MELIHLPKNLLIQIINNIDTTEDYNSLRLTCKIFHDLMSINKRFSNGISIEIYTFLKTNIFNQNVHWYEDGPIKKINNYNVDGIRHNYQKEYYKNRKLKNKNNYVSGIKHGLQKEYFKHGTLKSLCNYKNNVKVGNEFINNPKGQIKFIKYHKKNICEVKHYIRDKLESKFQSKNNILHGQCFLYSNNNLRKICCYNDGLLYGQMYLHNEYGLYEEINYYANEKNGAYIKYNNFGEIQIYANFKYDKLHGISKMFNLNGINTHIVEFKNGKLDGKYITNDICKKIYNFKENHLDGYYTEFYKNNNQKFRIKFQNNKFDNIYKKYFKDNTLDIEILITETGYKITKYIRNNYYFTFFKINNEYYYKIGNNKIHLNSYYMNPVFNEYML